jgi:hypothetical protein
MASASKGNAPTIATHKSERGIRRVAIIFLSVRRFVRSNTAIRTILLSRYVRSGSTPSRCRTRDRNGRGLRRVRSPVIPSPNLYSELPVEQAAEKAWHNLVRPHPLPHLRSLAKYTGSSRSRRAGPPAWPRLAATQNASPRPLITTCPAARPRLVWMEMKKGLTEW